MRKIQLKEWSINIIMKTADMDIGHITLPATILTTFTLKFISYLIHEVSIISSLLHGWGNKIKIK